MADGNQYVDRNLAQQTYRPKGYGISPGLQRARKPFLFSNMVTGAVVASFVLGVYYYSISAVRQDTFEDVDAEAKSLTTEARKNVETVEERGKKVEERLKAIAGERVAKVEKSLGKAEGVILKELAKVEREIVNASGRMAGLESNRGVLPKTVGERAWYAPSKGLVWGAPPVDSMGTIGDRKPDWK